VADRLGHAPPVVDAEDILTNPRRTLAALCTVCGIAFDGAMLAWPPGPKSFDGNWAPHWYNAVWASTGFTKPEATPAALPDHLQKIADAAQPLYERLARHRLTG
jgi:hypothetical protein